MLREKGELKGKSVLICEDHPVNIKITRKLLEQEGIMVSYAVNGKLGLDMFRESKPGTFDAVLMDICMPEMDGNEATRNIRALERDDARSIPIIAMTTNIFQRDLEREKASGMNAHLAKPVRKEELYQILDEYL